MFLTSNAKVIIGCIFVVSLSGCSRIHEHYFLRDKTTSLGELPNYYRVTVDGYASSSSRYIAGWYNENAVDAYFNEMTPNENQSFLPDQEDSKNKIVSINAEEENKKLVLLLSSNSDIIASQIGALAENEQLVDAFTRLSNKPTFIAGYEAKQALRDLNIMIESMKMAGSATIEKLDNTSTRVNIELAILQYLNILVAQLGSTSNFTSINDVEKWWVQNRNLIIYK